MFCLHFWVYQAYKDFKLSYLRFKCFKISIIDLIKTLEQGSFKKLPNEKNLDLHFQNTYGDQTQQNGKFE